MEQNCKECVHYNYERCVLDDLEPCRFVSRHERAKNRFLALVTIIAALVVTAALLWASKPEEETKAEPVYQSAMELLRAQHKGELTEWDKLILAISFTESRFNPDAVGKAGDTGHLQITPVYVEEINRLYGTDYTIEDAFDIDKSIEMFYLMQQFKNPTGNLEQAIYYHNKSAQYLNTVKENLAMIERYEALRKKLIETHY